MRKERNVMACTFNFSTILSYVAVFGGIDAAQNFYEVRHLTQ